MTDEAASETPWWHYAVWVTVAALVAGYAVWHWWDGRREDRERAAAESRVVVLVRAGTSPFLATATDHQIVSDAYGSCPRRARGELDTSGLTGGTDPDEDPAAARSGAIVLPLHEASAEEKAWLVMVGAAAEKAGLCQFVDD